MGDSFVVANDSEFGADKTSVVAVRYEYGEPALGVGNATPRLSWQVTTGHPVWTQTAYEIERDGRDTARVRSAEQVLVPWPFEPLQSRERTTVRVRVASGTVWSDWSAPATVEAGLLRASDWHGHFISPSSIGGIGQPAPIVARTFTVRAGIRSARLYITAHATYAATLNGAPVGDIVLPPGWSSYQKRLCYQTYDITELLNPGENTVDVLLGNGRYRGRIGPGTIAATYGDRLAVLAQLEITYDDMSRQVVVTDDTWTARESPIRHDDFYDGQVTDLRATAFATDTVAVVPTDTSTVIAPEGPPMRATGLVDAVDVWTSPSGATLIDFGQNLVGWVRLRVRNTTPENTVTIRHAELLEDGELCTRALLGANATDTYLLPSADEVVLEPSLTFHGFRYAEVTGVPDLRMDDIQAVVVNADLRRTGWFSCSDPDLDRFHENVVWSVRGNFLDVPTDCPQRAERLGWTGDVQAIAPTASFLFDTAGALSSWLRDLTLEQREDGSVPWIVPTPPGTMSFTAEGVAAGWGDAATVVPWTLYQRYGDRALLERQFPSMARWVDRVAAATDDGVRRTGFQFGDHFSPWYERDDSTADRDTENAVLATAYLVRSADIVTEAARTLGRRSDAIRYAKLAQRTRDAFAREFVTSSGRVASDTPTAYAMAIEWDLLPTDSLRKQAGERLAELVRGNAFRACTGYLGTPLITAALRSAGFPDLAYRLLLERGVPSWLYPVTIGATTVWEQWRAVLPDGTVNGGPVPGTDGQLAGLSLNHFALGAVADWMHRVVAGLAPAAPGYREIIVRPIAHPLLEHAEATHLTPYGRASVAWRRRDGQFSLDIDVPVGATATVHVPGKDPEVVRHGTHSWTVPDPCEAAFTE